ncbi:MAG TPA: hypothetical protein VLT79_11155 [Gemmatimonadales bacterium]|nr:hypothetical protein [Gemmatimonadales bacterium]
MRHVAYRKRRPLAGLAVIAGLLGGILAAVLPSKYTAQSSFFPEARSTSDLGGGFASLATLAGIMGGPAGFGQRPAQFFTDLVKSQAFQDSLAASTITIDSVGGTETVEQYLIKRAKTPALRRWRARKAVQKAIVTAILPSGVVVLKVTAKSPYAAAAMANRALEILDQLNIEFRRREATARRRFTEQFLESVQQRLTDAQNRLVAFQSANRTFMAPELQQKQRSLQTEVERLTMLQQQLETSIENARLTEYNDAPVVATVDIAKVPERPSGPLRGLIFVGMVVAVLLGAFWVIYLGWWR